MVPLGDVAHAFGNVLVSEVGHKVVKIDGFWGQVVSEELLKVDIVSLRLLVSYLIGISQVLPLICVRLISTTALRHALMGGDGLRIRLRHEAVAQACHSRLRRLSDINGVARLRLANILGQLRLLLDFSLLALDDTGRHIHVQAILLVVSIQIFDQSAISLAKWMCTKQEHIILLFVDKLMLAENCLQLIPEHKEIVVRGVRHFKHQLFRLRHKYVGKGQGPRNNLLIQGILE